MFPRHCQSAVGRSLAFHTTSILSLFTHFLRAKISAWRVYRLMLLIFQEMPKCWDLISPHHPCPFQDSTFANCWLNYFSLLKNNTMLACRVVCCSHPSDCCIWVCFLHQSDCCIRVCILHQSDCCTRVCISHQTYHSIWISCTNHSIKRKF